MEVLWKAFFGVINFWIGAAVQFNDVLHGFREGQGTGTASLEAKLLQKLMTMREEVVYEVFLIICKSYDALNRDWCLEILMGYGVSPQIKKIIRHYWNHLSMVARSGCYYGTPFKGHQGVTQGGPLYLTIFNMVVDAMI